MNTPRYLTVLHILNDGFKASLLLLLPFIAKEFQMNLTNVGSLGTAVNLMDILLALPAGYYAAKIGGLRLLTYALLAYALGFFFTGISPSYAVIVLAFMIAGLGFGLFHPVSFALVAKKSDKTKRGMNLGNFTAAGDIGRIAISSLTTFLIMYLGWRSVSLSCFAGLFIFSIVSLWFFNQKDAVDKGLQSISQDIPYKIFLKNAKYRLAITCFCIDTLASSALFVFIPFLLLKRGVPPALLGLLMSTFFFGNMFGKAALGRLVDKYGNSNVFIISEIFMAVFIWILSNSTFLPFIIISSIVLGIFTKGTVPVLTAMLSESVEYHNNFEKAFGLSAFFTGFASTIAPLLLGYLSDSFGIVFAFNISALIALSAIVPAVLFKTQSNGKML
jgi:MFS transporter, FSR family, fosmidomycin resistance protein